MSDQYSLADAARDIWKGNFSDKKSSQQRYAICNACEHFNKIVLTCGLCGCFMPAKTKLQNADCPAGKW